MPYGTGPGMPYMHLLNTHPLHTTSKSHACSPDAYWHEMARARGPLLLAILSAPTEPSLGQPLRVQVQNTPPHDQQHLHFTSRCAVCM